MRTVSLAALLFSTATGVVMASNTACNVMAFRVVREADGHLQRKVHHSAATLARWKVGAAAWSKAHHGKVYVGQPMRVQGDWKPLTFTCTDVALDAVQDGSLLTSEAPPEFVAFGATATDWVPQIPVETASIPPEETGGGFADGFYTLPVVPWSSGSSGAGTLLNGPAGPASFLPLGPEPTHGRLRLLPPKHPPQEVTLLPTPLAPPTIVPTPEPSAMVLLSTGVAAFGLGRVRRWLRV